MVKGEFDEYAGLNGILKAVDNEALLGFLNAQARQELGEGFESVLDEVSIDWKVRHLPSGKLEPEFEVTLKYVEGFNRIQNQDIKNAVGTYLARNGVKPIKYEETPQQVQSSELKGLEAA